MITSLVLAIAAVPAFAPPAPALDDANSGDGSSVGISSVVAVLDIAHSDYFSPNMMQRSTTAAAQWLVDQHLSKAAAQGVTLVILKHPYRWRPEPFEDYRFGGPDPDRRAALHGAIATARAQHRPLPRLCAYQALPGGDALSPSDQSILNDQRVAFDEDSWEAIGCKPWQQAMIDQRRRTRVQHLEPVWDIAFPAQWSFGIDVTELFLTSPLTASQVSPSPRPEIRCWFQRPVIEGPGETGRQAYVRTLRGFHAYCLPKGYTPVDILDAYTVQNATPQELYDGVCAADYDGSGYINGEDIDAFMPDFLAGDHRADFNGDFFVNGEDMDAFLIHWNAGC